MGKVKVNSSEKTEETKDGEKDEKKEELPKVSFFQLVSFLV